MGRSSGFIAMHAALTSGQINICLIPEDLLQKNNATNASGNNILGDIGVYIQQEFTFRFDTTLDNAVPTVIMKRRVKGLAALKVRESRFVFEAKSIQRMELLVLSTLKWMNPVTSNSFFEHFVIRFGRIGSFIGDLKEFFSLLLQEQVNESYKLILKLLLCHEGIHNLGQKRKCLSGPTNSGGGVMDASFSYDSSNDSWTCGIISLS
ncbi:hypothetical protein TanjilG_05562 [Lupinus angustifolius]|uniref:Uncharacterized protein n=1 Tax=Lupinus angustifolius TaxID=3871 RepID=A0A1J7HC76_LUPAN|nr:hypothetical protein TanjilG_05562 [Lupinus angustifolius]